MLGEVREMTTPDLEDREDPGIIQCRQLGGKQSWIHFLRRSLCRGWERGAGGGTYPTFARLREVTNHPLGVRDDIINPPVDSLEAGILQDYFPSGEQMKCRLERRLTPPPRPLNEFTIFDKVKNKFKTEKLPLK
jgi:hypothetical protein